MSFFDFPIYQPAQDLLSSESSSVASDSINIYVNEAEYGEAEQGLLSKILGATGNSLAEIKIKKIGTHTIIQVQRSWNSQRGIDIIFGVDKSQLMLQTEVLPYYPIQIDHRTLLFCDSLMVLKTDADKKKALWGCLKTYFKI
ncbi:MAG: hypothetical protein ACJA01_001659 [Saprospiraceae bacterium]|jgi:hypothetical protein